MSTVRERVDQWKAEGRVEGQSLSRSDGRARVAVLKETYGELLSDLVYRIENAALFDSAAPLPRDFELLLMKWDDVEQKLSLDAAADLADELDLTFETARKNAERLGLRHLPAEAQDDAARAAKAARLATEATVAGEKEAAMATVTRLLGSLALYCLPTPEEAPKMLSGEQRSIEH
ncbi:MAG: hypothetical protein Q4D79_03850 [Propionibacteriaceae bacterium]|nr:hypothetical protein [Propionibacteriaceae bacterium]